MLNLPKSTTPVPPPPSGPAVSPPILCAEDFEDYPVFRETFLLLATDARANTALREFGLLLHELVLEFWGFWPAHREGLFPAELRAAVADLRSGMPRGVDRIGYRPGDTARDPPCRGRRRRGPRSGRSRLPAGGRARLVARRGVLMGWDSKNYYPPGALGTVTVKATDFQKGRWKTAAQRYHKGTAGAFLAWAGDMALAFLDAWEQANLDHEKELHPRGFGELR